jgi:hypothetical protein
MANIRQLESGNWQVQVRRTGRPPTAKTFKTRADAARWARLLESEIDQGVFIDRSEAQRLTVGALIDRYLIEVTPLKKSARQETQRLLSLKADLGGYSLAVLRNTHIAEYRDRRLTSGAAGATVPTSSRWPSRTGAFPCPATPRSSCVGRLWPVAVSADSKGMKNNACFWPVTTAALQCCLLSCGLPLSQACGWVKSSPFSGGTWT